MLDLVITLLMLVVDGLAMLGILLRPGHRGSELSARQVLRHRKLRKWLADERRKRPVPELDLTCPGCEYCLNGLTTNRCPECGRTFSAEDFPLR